MDWTRVVTEELDVTPYLFFSVPLKIYDSSMHVLPQSVFLQIESGKK